MAPSELGRWKLSISQITILSTRSLRNKGSRGWDEILIHVLCFLIWRDFTIKTPKNSRITYNLLCRSTRIAKQMKPQKCFYYYWAQIAEVGKTPPYLSLLLAADSLSATGIDTVCGVARVKSMGSSNSSSAIMYRRSESSCINELS